MAEPCMMEKMDRDIGRTVGFQVDELMYIATIISIDDEAERFTVRTEDGQELTGPFDAVLLNPEKRMDELLEDYEPLGNGKFRSKKRNVESNWTPVPDPSLRVIAQTAGAIVGFALALAVLLTVIGFGIILTQIESSEWVETEGRVVEAYNAEDCSSDGEGGTTCTSYTAVTVAYTYEGRNYTTEDYSMLSNDWLNDAQYWYDVDFATVYVNPDQPDQAVHLPGWDGVLEEAFTLLFFTGLILGGYLFVFVPIWFVYAKVQRLTGIEAPSKKKKEDYDWNYWESDDSDTHGKDLPTTEADSGQGDGAQPVEDDPKEEKFW